MRLESVPKVYGNTARYYPLTNILGLRIALLAKSILEGSNISWQHNSGGNLRMKRNFKVEDYDMRELSDHAKTPSNALLSACI